VRYWRPWESGQPGPDEAEYTGEGNKAETQLRQSQRRRTGAANDAAFRRHGEPGAAVVTHETRTTAQSPPGPNALAKPGSAATCTWELHDASLSLMPARELKRESRIGATHHTRHPSAANAADVFSLWQPLLGCRQLVEVNVVVGSTAEMPLRGDMLVAHLTAAWPRLLALQYSARGWSGLSRIGVAALAGAVDGRTAAPALTRGPGVPLRAVRESGALRPLPPLLLGGYPAAHRTGLQVLSLGSGPPQGRSGWTAPQPLFLDDLPATLRALSLNGLQLRWGHEGSGYRTAPTSTQQHQKQLDSNGREAHPVQSPLPLTSPSSDEFLFPPSLRLLCLKFCRWQVFGVSLLQAVSHCYGLLEVNLTWTADAPPYKVPHHHRTREAAGPYGSGAEGIDTEGGVAWDMPGCGLRTVPARQRVVEGLAQYEKHQWSKLAAKLLWLERLELSCWLPESQEDLEERQREAAEEEEEEDTPGGQKIGETSRLELVEPPMPPSATPAAELAAVQEATTTTCDAGMAQVVRGVANMLRLRSLKLHSQMPNGWGDEVDWSVLSQTRGLVVLELSGLTRGSANRVLQIVRSTLPSCRLQVKVNNINDVLEELRRVDLLLDRTASAASAAQYTSRTTSSSVVGPGVISGASESTGQTARAVGNIGMSDSDADVELEEDIDAELLRELQQLELLLEAEGQEQEQLAG
ncbi:hypothetical protein VaNZ11_000313, partial [Volvox africanus]